MQMWKKITICSNSYKNNILKISYSYPENSWVVRPYSLWNVYLQTYRNNRKSLKCSILLIKIQTLPVNNSRTPGTKYAKFSGYYFYLNTNIYGDFQSCISVPSRLMFMLTRLTQTNELTYDCSSLLLLNLVIY